jgi:integrase
MRFVPVKSGLMLQTLLESGARASELVLLRVEDVRVSVLVKLLFHRM